MEAIDLSVYLNRDERNKFLADYFQKYFGKYILSVGGGGERFLKKYLPRISHVYELDIAGKPDIILNLENPGNLPFRDNAFDCVIATDVLEHLDNFHAIFRELRRVTKQYVLISLPNSANIHHLFKFIFDLPVYKLKNRVNHGKHSKFYGLPLNAPADRHKWFFSFTEIEDFIHYKSKNENFEIQEELAIGYCSSNFLKNSLKKLVGLIMGDGTRKNMFGTTYWCVLKVKK